MSRAGRNNVGKSFRHMRHGHKDVQQQHFNTEVLNWDSIVRYESELEELCISRFRWEGLAPTIDPRYLELTLLYQGYASIYLAQNDELNGIVRPGGWQAGKCSPMGTADRQMNYRDFFISANNGYTTLGSLDGSLESPIYDILGVPACLIWDNLSRYNFMETLRLYAYRLAEVDRAMDTNNRAQKNPLVFTGPQEAKKEMEQYCRSAGLNVPAFLRTDTSQVIEGQISQLFTPIPYTSLEMFDWKNRLMQEFKQLIGLEVMPTERVNVAEMPLVDEYSELRMLSYIEARRQVVPWLVVNGAMAQGGGVYWRRDDEGLIRDVNINVAQASKFNLLEQASQTGGDQGGKNNNAVDNEKIKKGDK